MAQLIVCFPPVYAASLPPVSSPTPDPDNSMQEKMLDFAAAVRADGSDAAGLQPHFVSAFISLGF